MLSLSRQLIILLISFIALTALLMAASSYWILSSNLETQIQARLELGRQYTESLWQVLDLQTRQTLELLAQRPTLKRLLENSEIEALSPYLATFQESTDLDFLYLIDAEGNYLAGTSTSSTVGGYIWQENLDAFTIIGGIYLNQAFLEEFDLESPFSYRFPSNAPLASTYRAETILLGREFEVLMLLSIEDILLNQQLALWLITGIAVGTVILASGLGGLFIRRRIHPLWRLREAAKRMGEGDLDNPIPLIESHSPDVATLQETLESSRQAIARSLHEIQAQRDWANSLMQAIIEGIVSYQEDGRIVFHSDSSAQMMQWRKSKIGRSLDDVFRTTEEDSLFSQVLPPIGGRKQVDLILEDGRIISVLITRARNLANGENSLVLRDVTEDSRRASAQAYYLAHMSHEFRTPLSGMKAAIELLREHQANLSIEEESQLLNSILMSVSTLQSLIDNLLEGSKLEARQFSLRRQKLSIEAILLDSIGTMKPLLSRRRQHLEIMESDETLKIWADKTRMIQVMVNLLSNASKYSPEGSPIEILIEKRENKLWLAVADKGAGVPESQQEQIFRQFVRLENSAESDHSTGLGLAVVRGIIEAHGGQVGVKARDGGGSIFWFELDLEDTRA